MPALFNTCSLSVFELLCPQIKLQWLALYQRGSPANELRLRHPEKHQHVVFTAAKRQGSSWQIRDIVDVFAKDVYARRGAKEGHISVAIEGKEKVAQSAQSSGLEFD